MSGISDSGIYCPLCQNSPALELRTEDKNSLNGTCPVCLRKYEIKRTGDDEYSLRVKISSLHLVGDTGVSVLKQLDRHTIPDKNIDKETRRQLRRLESLRMVRPVRPGKDGKGNTRWEITQRGIDFLG